MYALLKSKPANILAIETPALVLSTLIAELFYTFGSFTIELVVFFVTWYVISRIAHFLTPAEK